MESFALELCVEAWVFARSVHFVARQYAGQVMAWSRLRQVWRGRSF